jgi:type IV pilus assembly protein PilN
MTRINLLPWREEARKERQKQFVVTTLLSLVVTAGVVGLIHIQIDAMISHQNTRNGYLETEIKELDKKIAEIRDLEKTRKKLIERMKVIQQLQQSRPTIVHVFDELVRTVPDGVYLQSLKQNKDILQIKGEADSNARVSAYMRNLDGSEWLKSPGLDVIQVRDQKVERISSFELKVKQTSPDAEEKEEEGEEKQ